jgi:hypothetical protein
MKIQVLEARSPSASSGQALGRPAINPAQWVDAEEILPATVSLQHSLEGKYALNGHGQTAIMSPHLSSEEVPIQWNTRAACVRLRFSPVFF